MQPAEALEASEMKASDQVDGSEVAGEREVLAASERPAVRADFESGSYGEEERRIGDGAEAEFMLESTAVCPHCLEDIDKIQIVRMLRTKVNFVSSLPRRGQLLICPKCRIALAGALGGLI